MDNNHDGSKGIAGRDLRTVFIVSGRNREALNELVLFLKSLDLKQLTWNQASALTGKGNPTTFEVVSAGLHAAGAVLVLFTPDEDALLRDNCRESEEQIRSEPQSRPNVILEAGMSLALDSMRTILVKVGPTRAISDLDGFQYVSLSNAAESRIKLATLLRNAGCVIDTSGDYFTPGNAGNFNLNLTLPKSQRITRLYISEGDDIFYSAIHALRELQDGEVRIYAPTGVWTDSIAKAAWFSEIAEWLKKDPKPDQHGSEYGRDPTRNFIGVYGLPRKLPANSDERPKGQDAIQLAVQLNHIEGLFAPFNDLSCAHLYYLDLDPATIPGTGVIMLGDSLLFLGFAVTGKHKVDYGITLPEQDDIVNKVDQWFNNHVMDMAISNRIQDVRHQINVEHGMDNLRKLYGLQSRQISN